MTNDVMEFVLNLAITVYKYTGYKRVKDVNGHTYTELADCMPDDSVIYWSDLTSIDNVNEIKRGIEEFPELLCIDIPLCSGSDYSGCLVEQSNYRCILEDIGMYRGVYDVHGSYDSFGIVVNIKKLQDSNDVYEEVKDIIDALSEYCLYNDDDLSELEIEKEEEAWDDWVEYDFIYDLNKRFDIDIDDENCGDEIRSLFYKLADKANEYFEDDGGSMWINIDRVVAKCSLTNIVEEGIEFAEYPLYVEYKKLNEKAIDDVSFPLDYTNDGAIRYNQLSMWMYPELRNDSYINPVDEYYEDSN